MGTDPVKPEDLREVPQDEAEKLVHDIPEPPSDEEAPDVDTDNDSEELKDNG